MKRCTRLLRPILLSMVSFGLLLSPTVGSVPAAAAPAPPPTDMAQIFTQRKQLYDRISASTGIPWHYLAAADQYERTIAAAKKRPKRDGAIGVYYSEPEWTGLLNPDHSDTDPVSIAFFHGKGKDGDGDGKADPNNDADLLYSFAYAMKQRGTNEEDLLISLWEIYHNSRSVQRIKQFSSIYSAFDSLDLHAHAFPLPLTADYSYRSTWGAKRGWGGRRIHEGTDLYAGYGVPVLSTCYGIVEVKGWNPYGGWRIGLRDLNNVYHYYAHLSGFDKQLKRGDIVRPGQAIGWMGSSGYGKPGTSGKFPPHLHFGLYKDNGLTEWAFDPYPHLKKWERESRSRSTENKQKPGSP